jgi:hypothetical protein
MLSCYISKELVADKKIKCKAVRTEEGGANLSLLLQEKNAGYSRGIKQSRVREVVSDNQ